MITGKITGKNSDMGKATKTSFKKGQSGNPKGRPKGLTTKSELLKVFNNNFAEMAEVFKKYIDMSQGEFNRVAKSVESPQSKRPVKDLIAIRFVYDAIRRGHTGKMDFIMSVLTGTYNDGIHRDAPDKILDNTEFMRDIVKKTKTPECFEFIQLSSMQLCYYLVSEADMSEDRQKALTTAIKARLRIEVSKYESINRKLVETMLQKVSDVLKDGLSRNNPRLLMDMYSQLNSVLDGEYELFSNPATVQLPVKKKRGRPKGSKNKLKVKE